MDRTRTGDMRGCLRTVIRSGVGGRPGREAEQSLTPSLSDSGGGGRVQPAWG